MRADSWILQSLGTEKIHNAETEAARRRINRVLDIEAPFSMPNDQLRFIVDGLELNVFNLLSGSTSSKELCSASAEAFQISRVLPKEGSPIEIAKKLVWLGCLGILGDRSADVHRLLNEKELPALPLEDENWGVRVQSIILDIWLRLFRKNGWDDFDAIQLKVALLRSEQRDLEPKYLVKAEEEQDLRPAWELVLAYHLAKAAELLGTFLSQGSVDGHYDIREQLDAQFDRAISASANGKLMEEEMFVRLLAKTAQVLVDNSIWTVTRAVNSRVTKFVASLVDRNRAQPIFEMLPPQRRTLREEGLLGSGYRSAVVCLPTSSGKTFIAEFRILQALNQFETERGWVAYLAPTRALVNQLTLRLRRDLSGIGGCIVEKVSPALEIDGLESSMLAEQDTSRQFRILVTTPEKLDLMLRGGWEQKIGRPLTLLVVDEAHGLASTGRGLKLELLLATINRECRNAQFLLLTPFIENATDIARWLAPDNYKSFELGVDWVPNDRIITIAQPIKGSKKGDFYIKLLSKHSSKNSLEIPDEIELSSNRVLGFNWSQISASTSKLAAATAQVLQKRGTIVVLADSPRRVWDIANSFMVDENYCSSENADLTHICNFLADEMGDDFPLIKLLEYGIGVHHSGLSEDTRTLIEWLTEQSQLRVLVATTTIAQGVNFPVSGVVFASQQYRSSKFPYRTDMPPADFWNIAGRAGRVDQGDLGIIALAATNEEQSLKLEEYINVSIGDLNSTLVAMVQEVVNAGNQLKLEALSEQPGWSSFLQYLAHTYRQIGNHERFASEVEQVLRGTLGFQELRRSTPGLANALVASVYNYAQKIEGKPLKLVDATGFSWESVSHTLTHLKEAGVTNSVWSPDLFGTHREDLQRMIGVMLQVPELRESLAEVTGGPTPNGDKLSRIICDWVQGRTLQDMAKEYFSEKSGQPTSSIDPVDAMTNCCRSIFGRLTQTTSWGLAALQSLTIGDSIDSMSPDEQRVFRNLPARIYYGVNSDEAVALRLLGVPRTAAMPLAHYLKVDATDPLYQVRKTLRGASEKDWTAALGNRGSSYHRVWSIIEGNA